MSALHDILLRRIAATGPISIAEYMTECLLHPEHGYYTTRDPLGAAGDFVTAPEISQMFGELVGLCIAQAWIDQGRPDPFVLAELGPGRGTLMTDLLRATRAVPGFHAAARLHLVEVSPALRAVQAEALPEARGWHDRLDQLPEDGPLFLVANEFFDALPIRQFLREGAGWRERVIARDGDRLGFGLTAPAPLAELAHRLDDTSDGDMVETCPALPALAGEIGRRIAAQGGAALVVDYGAADATGDSFQAVQGHRKVDPLEAPGSADLTAHVDFGALARAAAPAACAGPVAQGVFLERLGITPRARALARGLEGAALETHVAAHRRLTHPGEMGDLFKVAALHPRGTPPPPGMDP
ncbi:class I SAM-dependent methyltransferase [Limimaricola pyoseonensis]|uniref:SAM-dependent methyltransferase, MidA family n=1 Tax=Limimaricola pyoseonensis TaxID=521013 RepID=A0A1G7ICV4_9RHOB|nr:SAM-dependent methyltransferase [Limimaricola pyoseonensis]SDF10336.1 SAM-dependent methyltransferase, MidA family [Limimaricola pyoseonensis]